MKVTIDNDRLAGRIKAIPSKSAAHRLLIASALTFLQGKREGNWAERIIIDRTNADIEATKTCLNRIIEAGTTKNRYERGLTIDCGESGSTLRFLLPIAGSLGLSMSFMTHGRLISRPLSPLYEELINHGCCLSPIGTNPISISGQLKGGNYFINGNISSQYITGLLFALPLLKEDSKLKVLGRLESKPYVDMTLEVLRLSGIVIKETYLENSGISYLINGGQSYRLNNNIKVEGDWSNSAFWMAAAAIDETEIICEGLKQESTQGDRAMAELLRRFGAEVDFGTEPEHGEKLGLKKETGLVEDIKYGTDSCRVKGIGRLKGIEIDASDIPDLVPILSVVGAAAEGTTIIKNAGRLRLKESDRLEAISVMLTELGTNILVTEDGMIINGGKRFKAGTVDSYNDHRIAMSAAIAATIAEGPVVIEGAEAVDKSYPGFYKDYKKLVMGRK